MDSVVYCGMSGAGIIDGALRLLASDGSSSSQVSMEAVMHFAITILCNMEALLQRVFFENNTLAFLCKSRPSINGEGRLEVFHAGHWAPTCGRHQFVML